MALFLGLDAGGTSTDCALALDDRILARTKGRSIKPLRVSREEAQQNISDLLGQIAGMSGVDLRIVSAICVGTAGVRLPQTQAWMRDILSACTGGEIEVCGDEDIALDGAFPGDAGVLIIAGTGSNIMGRTRSGERMNVGGWGPALGDEGSGYWIGHQAMRAAFRALDFGIPCTLLERAASEWNATSIGDLVNLANATPLPDFSKLAPLVVQCAEAGDAVCIEVLERGGHELGLFAVRAFQRVRQLDNSNPPPGFAWVGSILRNVGMVRQAMTDTIHEALPSAHIEAEAADPVIGALYRARQLVSR
jgi:N-acetylglucosamine kinase-like BadF-type ATPase